MRNVKRDLSMWQKRPIEISTPEHQYDIATRKETGKKESPSTYISGCGEKKRKKEKKKVPKHPYLRVRRMPRRRDIRMLFYSKRTHSIVREHIL